LFNPCPVSSHPDLVSPRSGSGYVLNMTSQQWFDSTVSDRPIWTHQLVVIVPDNVRYTTSAGLYVTGNCNDNPGVPSELDEDILVAAVLATTNGVITATLFQIPNCPIVFTSDPSVRPLSPLPFSCYFGGLFVVCRGMTSFCGAFLCNLRQTLFRVFTPLCLA
jgi:hypothetical protein